MSAADSPSESTMHRNPLKEIVKPFVDLVRAPRALWGVNLGYFIEGLVYFGMLNYLAMYFNQYVGLDDIRAGWMVLVLTAGITVSMFFFGTLADRWGVRRGLIFAFTLMILGRALVAYGGFMAKFTGPMGLWSAVHLVALVGLIIIVLGYGMYEPAAYSAVRQFTTQKTAAMGYAMLYALMNLGIVATVVFGPIRNAIEIKGCYWIFAGLTLLALLCTVFILTPRTVQTAKENAERAEPHEGVTPHHTTSHAPARSGTDTQINTHPRKPVPMHLWISLLVIVGCVYFISAPWCYWIWGAMLLGVIIYLFLPAAGQRYLLSWLANHPLADARFYFFIFCLIPVQTLFAHQWLTMPMYVERAFAEGWPSISKYFEITLAANPLLIFICVPIIASLTARTSVYKMMIIGTLIMAAPTFLLALGAHPATLFAYIGLMSVGEAIWQPRFLQYVTEIAPKHRSGAYVGVARLPWFLTKLIVPLYSGWFLQEFVPQEGNISSEKMWLYYGLIAMVSPVLLVVAKPWAAKGMTS